MIKIELSEKEWVALCEAGIGSKARRILFGTTGIAQKIHDQLVAIIGEISFNTYKHEWKKTEIPPSPPKPKITSKPKGINRNDKFPKGVWRS